MKEKTTTKIKQEMDLSVEIHNTLNKLNDLLKEYGMVTGGETKLINGINGYSFISTR